MQPLSLTQSRTLLARAFAVVLSLAVFNISVPASAIVTFGPDPRAPKPAPKAKPPVAKTRLLKAAEMQKMQGKLGTNPYLAGQNKWDVIYKGINLMTGNYSTSGTDLNFEGGYGIPANVTRSYSANNSDSGPLGIGWTLSVDMRNTAGGLLKGPSAPVRTVPTTFKERPAAQNDPHVSDANEPVEAVISTDSGGQDETVQKDADGILTTPSWDKNRNVSEYENVIIGGNLYQILSKNTVTTPEGTVYVYEKEGSYDSPGMVPYDNPSASGTPANVLKITSTTDRQGNQTVYTYGTGTVSFSKSNGTTTEHPLTSIQMPNGHTISFTWGSGATANRIVSASDGVRTVSYGYSSGMLTSVTSPAGKVTQYGYGSSVNYDTYTVRPTASNLLTSITDARGMTTTIAYAAGKAYADPYGVTLDSALAYKVTAPNGVATYVRFQGVYAPYLSSGLTTWLVHSEFFDVDDSVTPVLPIGSGGTAFNYGAVQTFTSSTHPWFKVRVGRTSNIAAWAPSEEGAPDGTPFNDVDDLRQGTLWSKTYDSLSQNLLEEDNYIYPRDMYSTSTLWSDRHMASTSNYQEVDKTTTYNFQGNPLVQTTSEINYSYEPLTAPSIYVQQSLRSTTKNYAYWGREKYYQQKAIKDQAGRYTYTDYYDWNATQGKKGQTYRVYDAKRTTFVLDTGITPPSSTPSGSYWKYQLVPQNASSYSTQFDYDSKGRVIDIWKLQSVATSPWTYVQIHTEYGADSAPSWGGALSLVEDYGSGHINRTTQTLAYDSIGRAISIQNAAGREFLTTYDLDGIIQSVYRVDGTHNDPLVTYAYGTSGILNGMMTGLTDGLSGVSQSFSYQTTAGGGYGQISSVTETNGSSSYEVDYSYNTSGDRDVATYTTPNGTSAWKYSDYIALGDPISPNRSFQTLNKLSSGSPTSEELHYQFDSSGRLTNAVFAQTPQSGHSNYTASYPAATRARAYYAYDPAGRPTSVEHYWDTWTGSAYTSAPILGNSCSYELTGLNRGLKTQSDFYVNSGGSWALDRSERFGYDSTLDYLTSASYDGGYTSTTWSYDAAGNRNDATVVDNLNRATTIGGVSRTYDIQGNTLTIGSSKSMTWDVLNRMASFASGSTTTSYSYRADGMRVSKNDGTASSRFYYDGQMPMETLDVDGSGSSVTRNGLGARGVDRIERTNSSGTTVAYPLYDGHGNMVATLTKSGSSCSIGDQRAYDAWGGIRVGATSGDPKGRYCANLGHVQDDESGFTYMRARSYEAATGRFVSEDPSMHGWNWYTFARNNPVKFADSSGKVSEIADELLGVLYINMRKLGEDIRLIGGALFIIAVISTIEPAPDPMDEAEQVGGSGALAAIGLLLFVIGQAIMWMSPAQFKSVANSAIGEIQLCGGLLLMGEAGLNIIGILLGVTSTDDADASVFGF